MKRILLFGSTGSIGRNVLDVVAANPGRFQIALLSCRRNVDLLIRQAREFSVTSVHVSDESALPRLKQSLPKSAAIFAGSAAYAEIIERVPADLVVNAIVGAAGLELSYHTLRAGRALALANKESLIAGGQLLNGMRAKTGAEILPIDSEHSAIWQCLRAGRELEVEKIILTASGGPFRTWQRQDLAKVRVEDALRHPNWSMGSKVTVDSATMMNKGLEVIEAHFLFGLKPDRIDIVVHPESIIHSLVQFVDGSQIAQLSPPDMRLPIAYALSYPDRISTRLPRTDLAAIASLNFEPPDRIKFPCISLAYNALEMGGLAPLTLNAANEVAVESFLAGRLKFVDLPSVIEKMLSRADAGAEISLEQLLQADREVRLRTEELILDGTPSSRKG